MSAFVVGVDGVLRLVDGNRIKRVRIVASNPNGSLSETLGTLAIDAAGNLYRCTSDPSGTAWTEITGGGGGGATSSDDVDNDSGVDSGDGTVSDALDFLESAIGSVVSGLGDLAPLDAVGSSQITDESVTLAKMAHIATARILGRVTSGSGAPEALTGTQATTLLDAMVGDTGSGGTKGLVPAPATGDADLYLRGDGTFQPPVWRYRAENTDSYTLVPEDHGQVIQVYNSGSTLDHVDVFITPDFFGCWVELMAPKSADIRLMARDEENAEAYYLNAGLTAVTVPAGAVARLVPTDASNWRVLIQPTLVVEPLSFALSDAKTTDLTTDADTVCFRVPYRFYIDDVRAYLHRDHPSTDGAVTVQVNLGTTGTFPLFDDLLTIDQGDTTSVGSAAPYTFSSEGARLLNDDDVGTISITGAGTEARGLVVQIIGRKFPLPAEAG